MRLPDFLIVGAQRSGTSTLYEDLLDAKGAFLPAVKEPYNLCDDSVLTEAGRAKYAALFSAASSAQRCGEASTRYTLQPHYERCATRARAVLGPDVRIVYLIREPIARAISHHRFDVAHGWVTADADTELLGHDRYTNAGRYAFQITPWIEEFGRERVHIERFEDFIADRPAALGRICAFLRIAPPALVETHRAVNASESLQPLEGTRARLLATDLYQRVRPMIPRRLRARLRHAVLPAARPIPDPPTGATVRALAERLAPEVEAISEIVGARQPLWDLRAVVASHEAKPEGGAPAAVSGRP